MSKLKIIHYDNQFLARAGFKYLVTESGNFRLLGSFESKDEFLNAVEKQLPNVVVFDFTSKDSLTIEDLDKLRKVSKKPGFLVISNDFKKETICEYMDCGVECFVTKACSKDEILLAIQAAAKGEKFFCNKVLDYIIEKSFAPKDNCDSTTLTKRELEILKITAQGLSNKEIADKLFLSLHTVYTHRKNIMKKLDIKSNSEFIKYAYDTGVVST
ncbi:MAG: response regulator transcription factor [Melioribacteraceae bacterium]|nr:response regulator transcription factor [Melioribacteraceae bacterium]